MTGKPAPVIDAILARRSSGPRHFGPRHFGPRQLGPRHLGPRQLGPRHLGPRHLGPPGPGPEGLHIFASAAAAAPDHGRLGPLRLTHIPDDKRVALADLFIEAARAADPNVPAAVIEAAGGRALSGPVLVAVIATVQNNDPDIAPHKQWISVGAALQNAPLAAQALGLACKMVNGRRVRSPVLRSAFRLAENVNLVGFVMFGTAGAETAAKPALRRSVNQILSDWRPPVL